MTGYCRIYYYFRSIVGLIVLCFVFTKKQLHDRISKSYAKAVQSTEQLKVFLTIHSVNLVQNTNLKVCSTTQTGAAV